MTHKLTAEEEALSSPTLSRSANSSHDRQASSLSLSSRSQKSFGKSSG